MTMERHPSAAVQWYMNEMTSRIVAKSGNPQDRFHLGKIILQGFKDDPQFIHQIDGMSGQSETQGEMLKRTIRCATAMRKMGVQVGDVIVLMAPNHLDLAVPLYSGLYLGAVVAPIDYNLRAYELVSTFESDKPKIVFCQSEKYKGVKEAINKLELDSIIVTFDQATSGLNFADLLSDYGEDDEYFECNDFDTEETLAMLIPTSGTTGLPKAAALTHKNMTFTSNVWIYFHEFPTPVRSVLTMAPLQWLSTIFKYLMAPYIRFTRIQSGLTLTEENIYDIINRHKPAFMILSPPLLTTLLKLGRREKCDFTCFDMILIGGSATHKELFESLKVASPRTSVAEVYGMTEAASFTFKPLFERSGSPGIPVDWFSYKLVKADTDEEINEPNVTGELWLKGPSMFKGYFNNDEGTKDALNEDGWYKSGDLFYRDENWKFYFVDRKKLLLKYRNHQISPVELENTIKQHPGVLEVAVTGIPDLECGDLPVACVVRKEGFEVTSQDIKDIVRNNLTDTKQLRGGVIFLKEMPLTASTKIHRQKLKQMVLTMDRE